MTGRGESDAGPGAGTAPPAERAPDVRSPLPTAPGIFYDQRLSAIVENSMDFIGMTELDGRGMFLNRAGRQLVGIGEDEDVTAWHLGDFFPADTRARVLEELVPLVLRDGRASTELDLCHLGTGRRIPVSMAAFRIDDPHTGRPVALATISRDLTDRQRAEEALRATRERVDTILESITDAFYALDANRRFTYLNDHAVTVLGELLGEPLQREDFLGNDLLVMLPELAGTSWESSVRLAAREHRPISFEYQYRRRWFNVHLYPAEPGLSVYVQEITDHKAAEADRESKAQRQALLAQLGVRAATCVDLDPFLQRATSLVARALPVQLVAITERVPEKRDPLLRAGVGWRSGAVGQPWRHNGNRSLIGRVLATGEPFVSANINDDPRCLPSPLLRQHGVCSAAAVAIPGAEAPFGALAVFDRDARRFTADDVNFIQAVANVLVSAIDRARAARVRREIIDAERWRIARTLNDQTLHDLGSACAGATDPTLVAALRRVDRQVRAAICHLRLGDATDRPFPELVEELAAAQRTMAPRCDVRLDMGRLTARPPPSTSVEILQILGEALANVRVHARASRVDIRIWNTAGSLFADVSDDGFGFDAAAGAPTVMEGHGLAVMHERAGYVGGQLTLSERERERGGVSVRLRVPLADAPAAKPIRLLIVEDHAAVREAISQALAADATMSVVGEAATLAEARTMLDTIDIAVIDIGLPDGDGSDLIEDLLALNPDAQALMLTAHPDPLHAARAVELGAAGVLGKTAHLQDIATSIHRLRRGETLMPPEEVVDLLRVAGRERQRESDEHRAMETLTPRELEILQLLADGLDNQGMAARLHISPRTQRNHMANILAKLDVHSQLQALLFAVRHGAVKIAASRPTS